MKNFLSDPRCARCNRILKDKESIKYGMGRACRKKHAAYVEKFYISLFPEVKHDKRRQAKAKVADAGRRADKANRKATVFQHEDDSARKKKDGPAEAEGLLRWTDGLSCTDA